jgi:hypothetical protein
VNGMDPTGRDDVVEYQVTLIPGGTLPAYPTLVAAGKGAAIAVGILKVLCWEDAAIVRVAKDLGKDAETSSWEEHACLALGP